MDDDAAPKLTRKPVMRTLFGMALPMLAGTIALNALNLADTWFVAQLGTEALAAMGFSFPVIMGGMVVVMGLGAGASATVSHALGAGEQERARRIVSDTLLLLIIISVVGSLLGLLTADPVFRLLGAGEEILPLIHEYMDVWYIGVVVVLLPKTCGDMIRSTGDMVRPAMVMVTVSLLNILFDPVLIFGWWGFPALGIRGAAIASILALGIGCMLQFVLLGKVHKLVSERWPSRDELIASWRAVLRIGVPASLGNLLMPVSGAILTRIIAVHGAAAVAATAAAGRLEMFAFMVPMCLGMSLMPFVGQNFGAGRFDRLQQARRFSMNVALVFGLFIAVVFFLAAGPLARAFSDDEEVLPVLILYLRMIPIGYGCMEAHRYATFFLNGMHRPYLSTALMILRVVVLLIPLSLLGSMWYEIEGIFAARAITDIVAGLAGIVLVRQVLGAMERRHQGEASAVSHK